MSQQPSHTKHFPSRPGAAGPPLTFTSNTSPPRNMTCVAHNQVSVPIWVLLLSVWHNEMAKAMTTPAGDGKYAPQRDCLKTIFQMNSTHVASHLQRCSACREGERFMHFGRTQEVDQAMRGAFSLHHISLIHFLVEWVKAPREEECRTVRQVIRAEGCWETNKSDTKQPKQQRTGPR